MCMPFKRNMMITNHAMANLPFTADVQEVSATFHCPSPDSKKALEQSLNIDTIEIHFNNKR